jgi:hypothetical protein
MNFQIELLVRLQLSPGRYVKKRAVDQPEHLENAQPGSEGLYREDVSGG